MEHSHTKQHYAIDSDKHLINITEVDSLNEKKYFCPCCNEEMIAKRGNIRQWHFAHKSDKCSYDRYLHSIAEIMIMDWFNQTERIELLLNNYDICDNNNCIFHDETNCKKSKVDKFNLKDYYSKCTKERKYNNFCADLYCENKRDLNSPIFIEIFVTHECSEEKKNSGIRIIELIIQSEEDIQSIITSDNLRESEKIKLYNFKPKPNRSKSITTTLYKYILYSSQKSYFSKNCPCNSTQRQGIYEVSISKNKFHSIFEDNLDFMITCRIWAFIDGYLDKDCLICKWQVQDTIGNKFCRLYKKCGNPKFCKDNEASKCSMFKVNIDHLLSTLKKDDLRNKPFIDIWKSESNNIASERHYDIASLENELANQKSYKISSNESNEYINDVVVKVYNDIDINSAIATQTYYCGDNANSILDLGIICDQHIKERLLPALKDITDEITIKFFTKNSSPKLICITSFYESNGVVEYNMDFIDSDF